MMKTFPKFNILFFGTFSILMFCGCWIMPGDRYRKKPDWDPDTHSANAKPAIIQQFKLDGCNWMIVMNDGKMLEPMNLKPEYQKDSLKVWIDFIPAKNTTSICMSGPVVEITEIELRK